ncbi:hypothetical protein ACU635_14595 [[Actinomadura] parvosata]|uniref:hypothetical protein n=1 Tax=[Actinomadura] parvosata TaxID=1955412 RepID=UPI00406CF856
MAVELTLVRMKLALLRHSREGKQGAMTSTGTALGGLLAAGTLWLSATGGADLLAAAYAVWMLGWILGPVVMGGGDESLRPEHFSLVGLKSHRLAGGLLAAAFVGTAPLISLAALLGLAVSGTREGVAGLLTAVPAIVLQLALFVLLSKVTVGLLGLALRSRLGAIGAGLVNGAVLAAGCQIWVFLAVFDQSGVPPAAWFLPSGWGLLAVRGDLVALAALAVLDVLLLASWTALLSRRSGAPRTSGRPRRPIMSRGADGAVVAKELRTWSRDLARNHQFVFALSFGVCFAASPLIIGWDGMLPAAGPIFVLMVASMTSNLYGSDGTALWLTLLTPGGDDVRGRQHAWLAVIAPAAVVLTLVTTTIAGGPWPLVLALLPALLGGAAGLVPLLSVYGLIPGTDPARRGGNPLRVSDDSGGLTGLAYLMLALVAATAVPAGLTATWYGWAGVPTGLATGLLCYWLLGRLAGHRLRARGPELLHTMRTGRRPGTTSRLATLPKHRHAVAWTGFGLGAVPLFPQGVVAGIFVANGFERHTWFLATYMPPALRWPVVVGMILLGLTAYGVAFLQVRRAGGVPEFPRILPMLRPPR